MTSDESMDTCRGLESQLTYDPAFLGWDFGCLFSTSCCPAVLCPWRLPGSPHKRCCPLPGVAIRRRWEGWGRGWLSFSSCSPSPCPPWWWVVSVWRLPTLGLFRLSKPTATPSPNSNLWHVWWVTWWMTQQGLLFHPKDQTYPGLEIVIPWWGRGGSHSSTIRLGWWACGKGRWLPHPWPGPTFWILQAL